MATSNNLDVLSDSQHRRHPVIRIPDGHQINVNQLKAELPQLWAQAVAEMDAGLFNDPSVVAGYAVRLPSVLWAAAEEDSSIHQQQGILFEFLNYLLNESEPAKSAGRVTGRSVLNAIQEHIGRVDMRAFTRTMSDVGWGKDTSRRREWGRGVTWTLTENPPPPDMRPSEAKPGDSAFFSG